jgi:aryl-alcohol dehydrogenase-like predicted oxidoreductase
MGDSPSTSIGVSNFSVAQLDEWMATGVPLHSDQPPYSILRPAAAEDVLPWCAAHDVGAISYSPLFRGLLFGTWSRDRTFGADDARRRPQGLLGPAISAAHRRRRRASGDRAE